MAAESLRPAALGSPPDVCPPSGRCDAAPLETRDESKDFGSKRLARSPGMTQPRHGPGLPGAATLTQGEHHLSAHPGHRTRIPTVPPCQHCPPSPTAPQDQTLRTPLPRGFGTLVVRGVSCSIPGGQLGGLRAAGGAQGPPKCAHLEAAPPHLGCGREDRSLPARAEQVHI